jgi:hypothetical protein
LGEEGREGKEHTFNKALLEGSEFADMRLDLAILVHIPRPLKRLRRLPIGYPTTASDRKGSTKRLLKGTAVFGENIRLFVGVMSLPLSSDYDVISLLKKDGDSDLHILHEEFHVLHLDVHDAGNFSDSFNLGAEIIGDGGVLELRLDVDEERGSLLPVHVGVASAEDDQVMDEMQVIDGFVHLGGDVSQGDGEVVEVGGHDGIVEFHARRELALKIDKLGSGGVESRVEGRAVVDEVVDIWGALLGCDHGGLEWAHHEPGEDGKEDEMHSQQEGFARVNSLLGLGGIVGAASRVSKENKRSSVVSYDFSI